MMVVVRGWKRPFAAAQSTLHLLAEIGVDLNVITEQLQDNGVAAFSQSFDTLQNALEYKQAIRLTNTDL